MSATYKVGLTLALFIALGCAAPGARADSFTFTGAPTTSNPINLFSFTVTNTSTVAINLTSSFDPTLALFAGGGDTLDLDFDANGLAPFTASLNLMLAPGRYFVGVTPLPLLPGANLSEGFFFANDQFGRPVTFADFGFTSGTFTLTIAGPGVTQAAAVPEPTTMLLLGTGLASAFAARKRKRRGAGVST